jgi:SAM-dependent methyltransferase
MSVPTDIPAWLAEAVRCPTCGGSLAVGDAELRCTACHQAFRRDGDLLGLVPADVADADNTSFYNEGDAARFGRDAETVDDASEGWVREFVASLEPDSVVVELGAGRGAFSGLHRRLVSCDLSWGALESYCTGPRVQADAQRLPFASASVDALFSVFTIEHVPEPERALAEIDRILKPGGRALLYPAWLVRPWASKALDIRPWSDLGPGDRVRKLTVPVRNSKPYRFLRILPGRLEREWRLRRGAESLPFTYRRLKPNLERYLASDSDAFSSMDPQAMSAYFLSRGYTDARRPGTMARVVYMYEPVEVRKPPGSTDSPAPT